MNRCGFVHMQTQEMADNAIQALNNTMFNGSNIVVERGRIKERKMKDGPGGGPGGRPGGGMGGGNRGGMGGGNRGGMGGNRGGNQGNRGGFNRGNNKQIGNRPLNGPNRMRNDKMKGKSRRNKIKSYLWFDLFFYYHLFWRFSLINNFINCFSNNF